jgi:hypothetical protein
MKSNWRWLVSAAALITLPIFWTIEIRPDVQILLTMLYPGTYTGGELGGPFNTWPVTIFGWIITLAIVGVGTVPHILAAREKKQSIQAQEK